MSEDEYIANIKMEIQELEEEIARREEDLTRMRTKLSYRKVDLQNAEFIRDHCLIGHAQ